MNYVRVGGYIPPQPIEDYNDLPNIPVISQDLTTSGFTPIANTYYKHTGTTTASYTNGVIYYYNSTGYIALDGSAYGLATVAKTGSYNDLSNKPTIPTVNDGTLTIQQNGQTVGTFTANQSTNTTANITVPTKASDIKALPISGGSITGDLTVGGNLTINGTTTTVDSTTLQVKDKLIEVAHGNTTTLTTPAGLVAPKYDGTNSGALVFDSTGTAYVGDVKLDSTGNIDVSKSDLQPLATRTGLVDGNLVQYDSSAQTLKDSGKKISDLALKTDLSGKANLAGGNTFSGVQTINAPTNVNGSDQATMKVKTSNGGAIIFGKEGANSGTMIRLDQSDGTCRLRFRSSATAGAMVWEQPEKGAQLYVDLGAHDNDYRRITFPSGAGTLALTSQLPTVNNGTLTIQKNGTTVQTFTANQSSSVTADITVPTKTSELTNDSGFLTSHQDISGKANLAGGNTFTGKQTLNNPPPNDYSIDAAGWIRGSWLQATQTSNKGANTGKVCVFDGAGWIYYRTPKEVIIDAECAVKYELKKTINFGQDGALYVGKFKVYDTNVTFEITSTTSVTYSGKLVIATQNYVISEMTVYGDAANTVTPNIYIKPSSTSDPYIEVYFKPASWSKNVVHIYGSAIEAEPTNVCTSVSAVPSTATLKPKNALPTYSLSGTTLTITL